MKNLLTLSLAASVALLLAETALAAPALKAEVDTPNAVVTVGDMFDGAGDLAGKPLFLAPAPGTTGSVDIVDIRAAAEKAGLADFDASGATTVPVTRLGKTVDGPLLTGLMTADLKARGILTDGMSIDASFDDVLTGLSAAATADPVQLVNLRFSPANGLFTARFVLAGQDQPLDVSGTLALMQQAPTLAETLGAGTILAANDIVMAPVPVAQVQNGNVAMLDQLIGKELQRQSVAGMVLKTTDVDDPDLVSRNELVTVYLHAGPLTLTLKGTALNAASLGQPVGVLNPLSKKIVHGVARADGAVEVTMGPVSVAGL